MADLIDRQAAIDIERNATVDTNPSHFEAHQKFTQFMDDVEISSFGRWQWSNGFNTALTAVGMDLKKLPSAQSDVPDTNVGDMISRRAATTIPVMPKEHRHYQTSNLDDAYEQGWNDLQECIENLPTIQTTNEMLERCKFEYIHACKVVSIPTPDTTWKDKQNAYAVIKALQPIFGDVPFAKAKRGDSDAAD